MTEQEFFTELLRIQSEPEENWSIELLQLECKCCEENCTYLLSLPEYIEFQSWVRVRIETKCRFKEWNFDTNITLCFKGSNIYNPSTYNNGDIVMGDDGALYVFLNDKFHIIKSSI